MTPKTLEEVVRNVDERLERVEQILPALATNIALQEAVAPLATKVELREAIAEAVAPVATKLEVRDEAERTRRYFDVVAGRFEGQIRLVAEGQMSLGERMDDFKTEIKADIRQLDRRVMRLEAARKA